jgi:hypothetical protein
VLTSAAQDEEETEEEAEEEPEYQTDTADRPVIERKD